MTISANNTEIDDIYYNGIRAQEVFINDQIIYRKMNGSVSMVWTGSGSGTFTVGLEDRARHFIVVSGAFSANGLSTGPIPKINGITCNTIFNDVDNGNNDGGRCGVFAIKIPDGVGTFSITNTDSVAAVYQVYGINALTAYATAANSGGSSISILAPAKGVTFTIGVRNFNTAVALANTDTDLRYAPNNPSIGATRNNYASPTTITIGSADYSQMMRSVSFAYDYY